MNHPAITRALPTAAAVLATGALILATAPGIPTSPADAPAGTSSVFTVTDPTRGLVNMHPALLQDAS